MARFLLGPERIVRARNITFLDPFYILLTVDSTYRHYSFLMFAVYIPNTFTSAYILAKGPNIEFSTIVALTVWWLLITSQLAAVAIPAVVIYEKVGL